METIGEAIKTGKIETTNVRRDCVDEIEKKQKQISDDAVDEVVHRDRCNRIEAKNKLAYSSVKLKKYADYFAGRSKKYPV